METLRTAVVPSDDLTKTALVLAIAIAAAAVMLLVVELVRRGRFAGERGRRGLVFATGFVAIAGLFVAIVRPQRLKSREVDVAPRVVVLLDRSRSMALSSTDHADGVPRIDVAEKAVKELRQRLGGRVDVLAFGARLDAETGDRQGTPLARADEGGSDLAGAIRALDARHDDAPSAIVVVSDGNVDVGDLATPSSASHRPPIHGVIVGDGSPPDASIRAVRVAGAAVAHQPLPLRIEVACTGGLSCGDLTITVRELREPAGPGGSDIAGGSDVLATGTATIHDGTATVELPVTLERAGVRAVEVSIGAPSGDEIKENDRRLLTLDVARERVRILHIAGRPTYDVRALRTWLKSDAAMDVVSFFILRTPGDEVHAPDEDLALIPFPVRELFTDYLPTFDAIIFQDFDAEPYQLMPHLPAIARYVEKGGGLIHVGGPNAFSAGGYAGTPLARVTPVEMPRLDPGEEEEQSADVTPFVPVMTAAARNAPILSELSSIIGDDMPELAGANILGDVRPGGVALWVHPKRRTPTGKEMPVLAIADVGDGRSVALGVDSTRRLAFSTFAAKTGGRAYDALWRGLLGWLMRDPRYEPVRGRLVHANGTPPCLAGAPAALRIEASPINGPARLKAQIAPLTSEKAKDGEGFSAIVDAAIDGAPPILVPLGTAAEGAYVMRLAIGPQDNNAELSLGALATRTIAACERGGDEWADPRPSRDRLESLAKATGGKVVAANDLGSIPAPKTAAISLERRVWPVLPTWAWSTIAVVLLGMHWFVRRRSGYA